MTDFFSVNFERLKALKDEQQSAHEVFSQARHKLHSLNLRVENLERLMAEEVSASGNPELKIELDEIIRGESRPVDESSQKAVVFKTDILANQLMKENMQGRGTTPKELYELLQASGFETISLELTQSTLGKLKRRGLVEQRNKRYFLTEIGLQHFEKPTD